MKTQRHENIRNTRDTKYLSLLHQGRWRLYFCNIVSKADWRTAWYSLSALQCNSLCRWMPVDWLSIDIFRRHHWCCQKSWAVFPGTIPYHGMARPIGFVVWCIEMPPDVITLCCSRHCCQCCIPHIQGSLEMQSQTYAVRLTSPYWCANWCQTLVCISDGHIIRRCEWWQNIIHRLIYIHHGTP